MDVWTIFELRGISKFLSNIILVGECFLRPLTLQVNKGLSSINVFDDI